MFRLSAKDYEKYCKQNNELRADDPRYQGAVHIRFEDGSSAFFNYAFCIKDHKAKALIVFTEHCGWHAFYLPSCEQYQYLIQG